LPVLVAIACSPDRIAMQEQSRPEPRPKANYDQITEEPTEVITPEEDGGPADADMPEGEAGVMVGTTSVVVTSRTASVKSTTKTTGMLAWKTLRTEVGIWTGNPFNVGIPYTSPTKRGFSDQEFEMPFTIPCETQLAGATAKSHHTARWRNLQGSRGDTGMEGRCAPPKPHFSMSTGSQQSGDGATLTVSAGHSVSLESINTNFGIPAASPSELTWVMDQSEIATGSATSVLPSHGTHEVRLSLINDAGQGEAAATIVVVPPDLADGCDNPVTDEVETNCDGQGGYQYSIGGVSDLGTQYCYEIDHYEYDPNTNTIEFIYTETVACWTVQQ